MSVLTQKSQVTIPKDVRDFLGIGPGTEVEFCVTKGHTVILRKRRSGIEKYRGFLGKARTDDLMRELR